MAILGKVSMNTLIQFFLLLAQIPVVLDCNSCKNLCQKSMSGTNLLSAFHWNIFKGLTCYILNLILKIHILCL